MSKEKSIVIEFEGGGFIVITDPSSVEIFVSRWDMNKVEYIMLGDHMIPGDTVTAVKGHLASGRVRYV